MGNARSLISLLLKLAFVVALFGFMILQKQEKPRILVIQSGGGDTLWTRSLEEGITRILVPRTAMVIRHHAMNLNESPDPTLPQTATSIALQMVKDWSPDIVMLFDDPAQKLVGTRLLNHPHIRIVYGGVNGRPEDYGYDKAPNVTGVLERKPLAALRDALVFIARARGFNLDDKAAARPRLLWLTDSSDSASADFSDVDHFDWEPLEWLPPRRVDNFPAWQITVEAAHQEADLLLVTDYSQLRTEPGSDRYVTPPALIMRWTEDHARIPVVGGSTGIAADGGMLGIAASGIAQGERAARKALALIRGEKKPDDMPPEIPRNLAVGMRKAQAIRRHLAFPALYEAFARQTEGFYE